MRHYLVDGNNLIGKIKTLRKLQSKSGQASREKLAFMVDRYFSNKNAKVTIYFDGFRELAINTAKARIQYSDKRTADDLIRFQIEAEHNPRLITLITSDSNLAEFARVCRCEVIQSEEFAAELQKPGSADEEEEKKKGIRDDEIKRLFGL
ncbi:MAG: NYN domain-containing protein [Ignavibacteriales bacterium]